MSGGAKDSPSAASRPHEPYPECGAFLAATLEELRNDPAIKLIIVGGTRHGYNPRVEADTFTQLAAIAPVVVMCDTPMAPDAGARLPAPEGCAGVRLAA